MLRAQVHGSRFEWGARDRVRSPRLREECASCGATTDLFPYGAALFCGECREQSDQFVGKELYCDLGGGD